MVINLVSDVDLSLFYIILLFFMNALSNSFVNLVHYLLLQLKYLQFMTFVCTLLTICMTKFTDSPPG